MVETSFGTISDVDVVILIVSAENSRRNSKLVTDSKFKEKGVIEATEEGIGKGDSIIIEKIKELNKPTILAINKIDLVKKESLLKVIDNYKDCYDFKAIIPISAEKNEGLEVLVKEIEKLLPVGPKYYGEAEFTDQTERQIIEEIIREKTLKLLDKEVPHGIFVEIEKMSKRKTKLNEPLFNIEAIIYYSKNSHKGIIIGKNGEMLKKIGTYARQDIEKLLKEKVNLRLWVKMKEDWQNPAQFLKKFRD